MGQSAEHQVVNSGQTGAGPQLQLIRGEGSPPSLVPDKSPTVDNRQLEIRAYWQQQFITLNHYDEPKSVTVGHRCGDDFMVLSDLAIDRSVPLVRFEDGEYLLTLTEEMQGEIEVDGKVRDLQSLLDTASERSKRQQATEAFYQIKLPPNARTLIHWGDATFALRFVSPPAKLSSLFFRRSELPYVNLLIISLIVHSILIATLLLNATPTDAIQFDLLSKDNAAIVTLILNLPDPKPTPEALLKKMKRPDRSQPRTVERPIPRTKLIARNSHTTRPALSSPERIHIKRRFERMFTELGATAMTEGASAAGLVGSLSRLMAPPTPSNLSPHAPGIGTRGKGPDGRSDAPTARGLGPVETSGRTGGDAEYGDIPSLGPGSTKRTRAIIDLGDVEVVGALSKSAIQRVIDGNKAQVRFCYEKQLQSQPQLNGRVVMQWLINAAGRATQIKVASSTLGSATVQACIRAKIAGWKFPKPAGGGVVEVNYPFLLQSR